MGVGSVWWGEECVVWVGVVAEYPFHTSPPRPAPVFGPEESVQYRFIENGIIKILAARKLFMYATGKSSVHVEFAIFLQG